jgi:hypothetical protein
MFLFYCSLLISFPSWSAEANLETAARKIARQKICWLAGSPLAELLQKSSLACWQ